MPQNRQARPAPLRVVDGVYYAVSIGFFFYLFNYYLTTAGGPTLLAFTLIPVTFILFTLNALRHDGLYPRLGPIANYVIGAFYCLLAATISIYMVTEFEEMGSARAGMWAPMDLVLGGAMVLLVLEYARLRHYELFWINVVAILYEVYGWLVPGMFNHPGLSWGRVVASMSVEASTGVFSVLPQLALTLIGSFILVLSALQAFGCIDSILKGASQIARRSAHALPQATVLGSIGVAAVSGSGAANAVTTGSATIPAMIRAGLSRVDSAAIESAASLGGQLMPPMMGISAFLMADFLGKSYAEVMTRGYIPALIYFVGVSVSVYLITTRAGTLKQAGPIPRMLWMDWINMSAFVAVIVGLVLLMSVVGVPELFAALYIFGLVAVLLVLRTAFEAVQSGRFDPRKFGRQILSFVDTFTSMTADLALLLAMLAILTAAFVNTGVPTKVGSLLVEAAGFHIAAMGLMAFIFGALLGLGLPPAPTYILTALVIAPHLIRAGMNPWAVHFFAFFLGVWGELTPPTSLVAAVTSKIAKAPFGGTLARGILVCSSLFVLMAAMFSRPELVIAPGAGQFGAAWYVLVATIGLTFAFQARFSAIRTVDWTARILLGLLTMITLLHPNTTVALTASAGVVLFAAYWVWVRRPIEDLSASRRNAAAAKPRLATATGGAKRRGRG